MKRTKGSKDLKRGLDLFHRLYPSPTPPSPQTTPRPVHNTEESPRLKTETRLTLPRMVSEPTIALERDGNDTEKQLDELATRPRRHRPRRLLSYHPPLAVPQQTAQIPAFPTSPTLLDPLKTLSAAYPMKTLRNPPSPVYLNLPQLPFGAHKSYNEIPNMRNLLFCLDIDTLDDTLSDSDSSSLPKTVNKREIADLSRVKTEKIRSKQGKSDLKASKTEFPLFFSETRRTYLAKSEAVLSRRKFHREKRPQRYFKHINEAIS